MSDYFSVPMDANQKKHLQRALAPVYLIALLMKFTYEKAFLSQKREAPIPIRQQLDNNQEIFQYGVFGFGVISSSLGISLVPVVGQPIGAAILAVYMASALTYAVSPWIKKYSYRLAGVSGDYTNEPSTPAANLFFTLGTGVTFLFTLPLSFLASSLIIGISATAMAIAVAAFVLKSLSVAVISASVALLSTPFLYRGARSLLNRLIQNKSLRELSMSKDRQLDSHVTKHEEAPAAANIRNDTGEQSITVECQDKDQKERPSDTDQGPKQVIHRNDSIRALSVIGNSQDSIVVIDDKTRDEAVNSDSGPLDAKSIENFRVSAHEIIEVQHEEETCPDTGESEEPLLQTTRSQSLSITKKSYSPSGRRPADGKSYKNSQN